MNSIDDKNGSVGDCSSFVLSQQRSKPSNLIHVLIVEDETALAEILEYNLQRHDFSTSIAYDGLEACRLVGREKPDIILLDIMIPLLDGWEICRMIRNHEEKELRQVPIIILSALGSDEDIRKGYELGVNHYLPKPYNIREIIAHSRQLTGRSSNDPSLQ